MHLHFYADILDAKKDAYLHSLVNDHGSELDPLVLEDEVASGAATRGADDVSPREDSQLGLVLVPQVHLLVVRGQLPGLFFQLSQLAQLRKLLSVLDEVVQGQGCYRRVERLSAVGADTNDVESGLVDLWGQEKIFHEILKW